MQIDIIQYGRVLRRIDHEGQTYVEAPTGGEYKLRVTNNCHRRRLAIVSVDGVNVVNGEDASYEGGGYVLEPWQVIEIPGFRRDDGTVAAFQFTEQGGSYAAKMGKGTKNVGVIGLAVFDEKVVRKVPEPPVVIHEHHHHHHDWGRGILRGANPQWGTTTADPPITPIGEVTCNTQPDTLSNDVGTGYGEAMPAAAGAAAADSLGFDMEPERSVPIGERSLGERLDAYRNGDYQPNTRARRRVTKGVEATKDVGTGYGRQVRFNTMETTFTRATEQPVLVLALRYATRSRLESWGVPVEKPNQGPLAANPFPAAGPSVPAPPGWRG